jgi:hypothetical protein
METNRPANTVNIAEVLRKDEFCMLVPNGLLPADDMEPQKTQPLLRALFAAMHRQGWTFIDWGEAHDTHTEATFLPPDSP